MTPLKPAAVTPGGKHARARHVEVDGHEFPFSRGASFYEVSSRGQILYGRDLVEPALKPGSSALLVSMCQDSAAVAMALKVVLHMKVS